MDNPNATNCVTAKPPSCEWVYFATPSRGSWTVTAKFVSEAKTIIRNVYNSAGLRIANVSNLEPGDKILLVYGGSGKPYRPLFAATIAMAPVPVQGSEHSFAVFTYIDERFWERLQDSNYSPAPRIGKYVGIAVEDIHDLRRLTCTIRRPAGMNTLRRWREVFETVTAV
jgi:hypothetical protein